MKINNIEYGKKPVHLKLLNTLKTLTTIRRGYIASSSFCFGIRKNLSRGGFRK